MAIKPESLTQEQWDAWPDCLVPGCPNKCCLSLRSKYCWPHTPGTPEQALDNLRKTEPELFEELACECREGQGTGSEGNAL